MWLLASPLGCSPARGGLAAHFPSLESHGLYLDFPGGAASQLGRACAAFTPSARLSVPAPGIHYRCWARCRISRLVPRPAADLGNPPEGDDVGLHFGVILLQVDSSCTFMYPAVAPWSGRASAAVTPDMGVPCSYWSTPLTVLRPGGAWRLTSPACRTAWGLPWLGCVTAREGRDGFHP